jgi:PDZ domain-containing protein
MTDVDTTAAGEAGAIPPPPGRAGHARPRRGFRAFVVAFVVVVVVLAVVWWGLGLWTVNYYAITPGDATPVASFITVPAALDHRLSGKILLTDVYVTQLTAQSYIQQRYFSSDSQVVSSGDLIGTTTPADQFVDQGYLEMTQAQSYATSAALTYLGYKVSAHDAGALIYGITAGSPAASALKVAQVITGVDGKPTLSQCALVSALHGLLPGTSITLRVEKSTINGSGTFEAGPTVEKKVTLAKPPAGLTDAGCSVKPTALTAYLGIEPETQIAWTFPVKVGVHTADIGGPSAGLAMTLGIIDKLSGGDLTGRRIVAATGTIDPSGAVGDVGGVAQKTIAVERAGATVFFVPPQELAAARSKDTPQLHIYAVSSLDQALRILKRLGGTITTSHVSAQAAP